MPKVEEWDELDEMARGDLVLLIDEVRDALVDSENAGETLIFLAEKLHVDLTA